MYEYRAHINSVYDGDGSFDAVIDLGMGISIDRKIRLYGIDTPEMKLTHKAAGTIVRDYVRNLMLGKDVIITTHRDATGKYGRLLADIRIDGVDLCTDLLLKGYGLPYTGGTKLKWSDELLQEITKNHP